MKEDINKGFNDLRQDLTAAHQKAAYALQPELHQRGHAQQPAYNQNFNAAAHTPALQGNSQATSTTASAWGS